MIGQMMPRELQTMPRPSPLELGDAMPLAKVGSMGPNPAAGGASFDGLLGRLVNDVNAKQVQSAATVREMMGGGEVSLHEAMIAMEEANVSFQLMVEVRNKLLESYQEIMRMQL